ncbi:S24 family peptidase [Hydrocarboniphaga effusa]|uniref:S24 family peptidase n=1 Tax=Hydrocarboniphaga effusa TaxID=243629 RepID=UPI003BA94447
MSTSPDNVKADVEYVGHRLKEEVQRVGGVGKADEVLKSSRSTLYNWFESGLIPATELASLAKIGVDVLYVVTGSPNLMSPQSRAIDAATGAMEGLQRYLVSSEARQIKVTVGGTDFWVDPTEYRWIPFFDVEIAGGGGRVVDFNAPPKKFNAYRNDYLEELGLLEAELFEGTVVSDSMYPEIQHGDVILVNASNKTITSGEVYVMRMDDEFICKYLRRLPAGVVEVYSANEDVHKPFTIREGEIGNGIDIVGHVVRQGRDRVRR